MYQPIKFTKQQYVKLRDLIRREFGNVSLAKGIYIITYLYVKYVPVSVKDTYRKKYYRGFNKSKRGLYNKNGFKC